MYAKHCLQRANVQNGHKTGDGSKQGNGPKKGKGPKTGKGPEKDTASEPEPRFVARCEPREMGMRLGLASANVRASGGHAFLATLQGSND